MEPLSKNLKTNGNLWIIWHLLLRLSSSTMTSSPSSADQLSRIGRLRVLSLCWRKYTSVVRQPFHQFIRATTTLSRPLSLRFWPLPKKMTGRYSLTVPTLLRPISWDDESYQRLDLGVAWVKLGYLVKEVPEFVLNSVQKLRTDGASRFL